MNSRYSHNNAREVGTIVMPILKRRNGGTESISDPVDGRMEARLRT